MRTAIVEAPATRRKADAVRSASPISAGAMEALRKRGRQFRLPQPPGRRPKPLPHVQIPTSTHTRPPQRFSDEEVPGSSPGSPTGDLPAETKWLSASVLRLCAGTRKIAEPYVRRMTNSTGSAERMQRTLAGPRRLTSGRRPMNEMLALSREECLELLASHHFGRLAVVMPNGSPVIRPVNYVFDPRSQSVVFRTARGSKFHALLRASKAAFEIDGVDHETRTGWSVIIEGVTAEVTVPHDIGRLNRLGLQPWAPGQKPHWVQIRARTVSGRRIVLADRAAPGY